MKHRPIHIQSLALTFSHKTCFEDFSAVIQLGMRIAITGQNGTGKSSLLQIILGSKEPTAGQITLPPDLLCGYVPQIIESFSSLSGGERFQKALTEALRNGPNLLLLDEPTNHLDAKHRASLFMLLERYRGTVIVVSHDQELLQRYVETFWHIEDGKIEVFTGSYDDFCAKKIDVREALEQELAWLKQDRSRVHDDLMREQKRAKKRKEYGQKKYAGDKMARRGKEQQGQNTTCRLQKALSAQKENVLTALHALHIPELVVPAFHIQGKNTSRVPVSVSDGACGYGESPILQGITLTLAKEERVAICGQNGSGKSTLIKALLGDPSVQRSGSWLVPKPEDIGYLDQHYHIGAPESTPYEAIKRGRAEWSDETVRKHLARFLFRRNEEVYAPMQTLSGGERARLSLALLTMQSREMLVIDEPTNNIDRETKEHIIQVLNAFQGAMIVISHDSDFLHRIAITSYYEIRHASLKNASFFVSPYN